MFKSKIEIRRFEYEDAYALSKILDSDSVRKSITLYISKPFKESDANNLINSDCNIYAVLYKNILAGGILFYGEFKNLDLYFFLGEEFWNKGIMIKALKLALNSLPKEISTISAIIPSDVKGAHVVLESNKFKLKHKDTEGFDRFELKLK